MRHQIGVYTYPMKTMKDHLEQYKVRLIIHRKRKKTYKNTELRGKVIKESP